MVFRRLGCKVRTATFWWSRVLKFGSFQKLSLFRVNYRWFQGEDFTLSPANLGNLATLLKKASQNSPEKSEVGLHVNHWITTSCDEVPYYDPIDPHAALLHGERAPPFMQSYSYRHEQSSLRGFGSLPGHENFRSVTSAIDNLVRKVWI